MKLAEAQTYASAIAGWISKYTEKFEIAGSIRRNKPEVNDVDIVCIPLFHKEHDLLGETYRSENLLHTQILNMEKLGRIKIISGRQIPTNQMLIETKKCQLDLWFADAENFASRLMCRTGSMEHNIWLVQHAKHWAMKWSPYEGVWTGGYWKSLGTKEEEYIGGTLCKYGCEEMIYSMLKLPFIRPEDREREFLVKNFGE